MGLAITENSIQASVTISLLSVILPAVYIDINSCYWH